MPPAVNLPKNTYATTNFYAQYNIIKVLANISRIQLLILYNNRSVLSWIFFVRHLYLLPYRLKIQDFYQVVSIFETCGRQGRHIGSRQS